jgi:hypothetical protein
MKRKLTGLSEAVDEIEDWKCQFVEWAEALMTMIWRRPVQNTAPRVNALQGWMEESPI